MNDSLRLVSEDLLGLEKIGLAQAVRACSTTTNPSKDLKTKKIKPKCYVFVLVAGAGTRIAL